jgi:hypothetical protein
MYIYIYRLYIYIWYFTFIHYVTYILHAYQISKYQFLVGHGCPQCYFEFTHRWIRRIGKPFRKLTILLSGLQCAAVNKKWQCLSQKTQEIARVFGRSFEGRMFPCPTGSWNISILRRPHTHTPLLTDYIIQHCSYLLVGCFRHHQNGTHHINVSEYFLYTEGNVCPPFLFAIFTGKWWETSGFRGSRPLVKGT